MNVDDDLEPTTVPATEEFPATPDAFSEVALQTRRAVVPTVIFGVVGLVIATALGQPLAGVGVCLGLAFGMLNARMLMGSVMRRFEILSATPGGKRPRFLSSGFGRLGVLTGVTILLVWLVRPLGFGVVIGMAVFQITMLTMAAAVLRKQVRA